ncbi:MAG: double-strand break repair protein AddB [Pseudomonadota bacterium]
MKEQLQPGNPEQQLRSPNSRPSSRPTSRPDWAQGHSVVSIPAGIPFADCLAKHLIDSARDSDGRPDPLRLSAITVLLPTRRACRTLREAFLRTALRPGEEQTEEPHAILLPRISPIGDVDEDELLLSSGGSSGTGETGFGSEVEDMPPPISGLRRQMILSRLIMKWGDTLATQRIAVAPRSADQAARLAGELGRLIDRVETEQLSFANLTDLVPSEFADHWQLTLDFLRIVTEAWPDILESEGALDPATHRNRLIELQATRWREQEPQGLIVAAGSTGSIPATAKLLQLISQLPNGLIVLPGLDQTMTAEIARAVGADPTHPQYGMVRLLERMSVALESVPDLTLPLPDDLERRREARSALLTRSLRPSASPPSALKEGETARLEAGTEGLSVVVAPTQESEANAVALMMRGTLETAGKTAALITADRTLARRVSVALGRYGLEIDDSAGKPLLETTVGSFFRLITQAAAEEFAPVPLLSVCKHPLALGGEPAPVFRDRSRLLEMHVLRGPRPAPGLDGLRAAFDESLRSAQLDDARDKTMLVAELDIASALGVLDRVFRPLTDLLALESVPIVDLLRAHVRAAEMLSAGEEDQESPSNVWQGEEGEALALFVAEVERASVGFPEIPGSQYPALIDALMAGRVVRPRYGSHPRLSIWGPLEARLQSADLMILGGLNEGSWPAEAVSDPWMSRPMQAQFGLPLPERRIGLSAHDFVQAATAPNVVLTRADRVSGTPTVPTRWLLKIEALVDGIVQLQYADTDTAPENRPKLLSDLLSLDDTGSAPVSVLALEAKFRRPDPIERIVRPMPRPPLAARPKRFSVTEIERWLLDPYAIYARRILNLSPLDDLDPPPGAAERGSAIHDALDTFMQRYGDALPKNAPEELIAIGREIFQRTMDRPSVWAFWWPRFEAVAHWFVEMEVQRRPTVDRVLTEISGKIEIPGSRAGAALTGKGDRFDIDVDGSVTIIDYKTGKPPSNADVLKGRAPQLSLEAAMVTQGGFSELGARHVAALEYWRLTGGREPGKIQSVEKAKKGVADHLVENGEINLGALAAEALEGVCRLVAAFEDERTPYAASPNTARQLKFNDYTHLARLLEWGVVDGFEGDL